MRSNITLMKWMIANGYQDKRTLERRIKAMEAWIADPKLLKGDADADGALIASVARRAFSGTALGRVPAGGTSPRGAGGGTGAISFRCGSSEPLTSGRPFTLTSAR